MHAGSHSNSLAISSCRVHHLLGLQVLDWRQRNSIVFGISAAAAAAAGVVVVLRRRVFPVLHGVVIELKLNV
jgi:hypothetical protein